MSPKKSGFGSIEKRGTNVYRIRWTDKAGNRRSETVKGPRHVAQSKLAEVQLGLYAGKGAMTYGQYWDGFVLPSLSMLSENTQHEYKTSWRRHLEPSLRDAVMADTDWVLVESVLGSIDATSSQRKAYRLWRKILNMAMRDRQKTNVLSNPCDGSIHLRAHVKREKVLLESQDVVEWMRAIRGIKYEPVLLTLAGSGMRPGEAMGLKWEDVERVRVIGGTYTKARVERSVIVVDNKKLEKDSPKNASSNRNVIIAEPFASRLEELRSEGPLCPGPNGSSTSPATAAHNYKDWCSRNGVKHVTFENLRTSYSVIAGEAGCADSLVDFQLGHAGATTRARHYQVSTLKGLAVVASDISEYLWSLCPCGSYFLGQSWANLGPML